METIQERTFDLRNRAMDALMALIADIKAAKAAGVPDAQLTAAREFQRHGQFYLDFVESENSNGFHAPQEAAAHPGRGHRLPAAGAAGLAARGRARREMSRRLPGSMLAEHRARGVERLAVDLEGVPRLARQPGARLEQVPHDVRRDDHHRGVLQRDGPHVRGLMAVHPRLPAELAGLNRRNLAHLTDP